MIFRSKTVRNQFHPEAFNRRFPVPVGCGSLRTGKDPVMDPAIEPTDAALEVDARESERPRASDWLWRQWHAKLWWTAMAAYWLGKVGSIYLPALGEFYTSTLAGFLNVAFFPPLALIVLGLGYARAWFAWSDWGFVEPTHEQMFPKRSVGGMRDPYSDPLDPRSGALHWRYLDDGR